MTKRAKPTRYPRRGPVLALLRHLGYAPQHVERVTITDAGITVTHYLLDADGDRILDGQVARRRDTRHAWSDDRDGTGVRYPEVFEALFGGPRP